MKLKRSIPFTRIKDEYLALKPELDQAYMRIMESGYYIMGAELASFEAEFANYCGVRHCVGVGNGLDALSLILAAMDIGQGDEVIVPAYTFIATWLAASNIGAIPVPVDSAANNYNIDPEKIASAITRKTKAIIVTHMHGHPVDMDAVLEIADKHGILVIEDAAQAHGSSYKGKNVGSLGYAAGFSFYPTKNLGAFGDGGCVTTNDSALAEKIMAMRSYGSLQKGEHKLQGVNSRLDELQAAFLRVKLRHLDSWIEKKQLLAASYTKFLSGCDWIKLPPISEYVEHSWHLFVVQAKERSALQQHLAGAGIDTMLHYPKSIYKQDAYAYLNLTDADFPNNARRAGNILSLPMSPFMDEEDVDYVVEEMQEFFGERI